MAVFLMSRNSNISAMGWGRKTVEI